MSQFIDKIAKVVQKNRLQKSEEHGKEVQKDLNLLLNFYFSNYQENKDSFDKINLEWKKRCHQINSTQKLIIVKPEGFELEVKRIISENPQFQDKEQVIDLTKL